MNRKSNDERIDFFLRAKDWHGELSNCEPDKCDELAWRALNRLPVNVIPYVRHALTNYANRIWFSEFGW